MKNLIVKHPMRVLLSLLLVMQTAYVVLSISTLRIIMKEPILAVMGPYGAEVLLILSVVVGFWAIWGTVKPEGKGKQSHSTPIGNPRR